MKNIRLAFIGLIGLCLYTAANAQSNTVTTPPCEDQWCKDMAFNLGFCDERGHAVRKCSSDPNNEPGLQPLKQALPMTLCPSFDHEYLRVVFNPSNPLDPNPRPEAVVFDWRNVETRLREAARRWDNLCPPQGPNDEYSYCCLRVIWSSSLDDLGDYPEYTRGYTEIALRSKPDGCGADCATAYMVINKQKEFTQPDENGVPRNFFYTESDKKGEITGEYKYVSLYSLFLHELGHWAGFQHGDESTCNHDGSIMRNGYLDEWVGVDRDLSPEDICMFKKLYCCESAKDLSDVEKHQEFAHGAYFDVVPNPPTTGTVNIRMEKPITIQNAKIRVVNMAGEVIVEQVAPKEMREISVDVGSLAGGMYMIELISKEVIFARKVLIEH
jgi:hypothetical protein